MLTDRRYIALALDKLGFGARSTIYEVLLIKGFELWVRDLHYLRGTIENSLDCGYVICMILVAVLLRPVDIGGFVRTRPICGSVCQR
ncbi:hypothetical protein BDV30DRAFT_206298 [Aspergillus minisclerotigenes]|uniref:Uncharacterized protein n=1 Tax=Aspergillus minisclerotigenes TaxID=656917 RepID=A0A5N6JD46_9EURO|nr:hypothetical protein BDV30DRAFT_206298 [Aspergillus minisclerotigenes]